MPNSSFAHTAADRLISDLESKLEDTIELLHLWKDEALAYRSLLQEVASGRVSPRRAGELLEEFLKGG